MASSRESPLATRRSPEPFCGPGSGSSELGQVRVGTVLQPGPPRRSLHGGAWPALRVCVLSASLHRLRPRSASCAPGGLPGSTVLLLRSGQAQGGWTPQPSPNLCSLNCFRRPLSTRVAAGHTSIRARVCSSHTVPSATGSSPLQLQATACSPSAFTQGAWQERSPPCQSWDDR